MKKNQIKFVLKNSTLTITDVESNAVFEYEVFDLKGQSCIIGEFTNEFTIQLKSKTSYMIMVYNRFSYCVQKIDTSIEKIKTTAHVKTIVPKC